MQAPRSKPKLARLESKYPGITGKMLYINPRPDLFKNEIDRYFVKCDLEKSAP
jgi:hypothetical protein